MKEKSGEDPADHGMAPPRDSSAEAKLQAQACGKPVQGEGIWDKPVKVPMIPVNTTRKMRWREKVWASRQGPSWSLNPH